jgi:hypothetical protein
MRPMQITYKLNGHLHVRFTNSDKMICPKCGAELRIGDIVAVKNGRSGNRTVYHRKCARVLNLITG